MVVSTRKHYIFIIYIVFLFEPIIFFMCYIKTYFYSDSCDIAFGTKVAFNIGGAFFCFDICVVTPGVDSATSVTLEQEKYFASLVAATPMGNQYYAADSSLSSLGSFLLHCPVPSTSVGRPVLAHLTPVGLRHSPMAFLASSFRGSAEKAMCM